VGGVACSCSLGRKALGLLAAALAPADLPADRLHRGASLAGSLRVGLSLDDLAVDAPPHLVNAAHPLAPLSSTTCARKVTAGGRRRGLGIGSDSALCGRRPATGQADRGIRQRPSTCTPSRRPSRSAR